MDRNELRKLISEVQFLHEVFAGHSGTVKIKSIHELFAFVEASIKESKPRTEQFRALCRFLSRASYLSPEPVIREAATKLILGHRHIFHTRSEISPSRFEGSQFLNPIDWPHLPSSSSTSLTHLDWILSSQGEFLSLHEKSIDMLMKSDGPLPRPWRHFIAIIGSAVHNCEYLVRNQMAEFLASGGEPDWLLGEHVPKKLKCLANINSVMAHSPWALDASYIEFVVTNGRWSSAELVHALVILATFQSLSSLVFGAGTKLEDDLLCESELTTANDLIENEPIWDEQNRLPACFMVNDGAPNLLQRLLLQSGKQVGPTISQRSDSSGGGENPISEFEGFGALNEAAGGASPPAAPITAAQTGPPAITPAARLKFEEKEELSAIMSSAPIWKSLVSDSINSLLRVEQKYKDFNPKTDKTLHTMSFSWEDHGMMIMARQLNEVTDCINEEHTHALEFTTHSIGNEAIDSTTTVREAIVKYVQRMYGVFHDDYRYDRLNRILPVIHKAYLKKLACYPERLTRVDYMRMRKFEGFTSKDLIHYAHLVSQTRRIVALTWAMKALMQYQGGGGSDV